MHIQDQNMPGPKERASEMKKSRDCIEVKMRRSSACLRVGNVTIPASLLGK